MLNIVIPMAGRGSRFAEAGFTLPKPLIPLGGKPMVQWVIENLRPAQAHRFHFICLAEHLERYPDVAVALRKLAPGSSITPVRAVTEGAACTVLLTRRLIDTEDPLMIANSDQFVDVDIDLYLAASERPGVDGLIMTFPSQDPKWSYCRMQLDGFVREVVEKRVVSNVATVGIYNFRHGRDFVSGADEMIAANERVNHEFYVAPVYNRLIAAGKRVTTFSVGAEGRGMHGLGTPADYDAFQRSACFLKRAGGGAATRDNPPWEANL